MSQKDIDFVILLFWTFFVHIISFSWLVDSPGSGSLLVVKFGGKKHWVQLEVSFGSRRQCGINSCKSKECNSFLHCFRYSAHTRLQGKIGSPRELHFGAKSEHSMASTRPLAAQFLLFIIPIVFFMSSANSSLLSSGTSIGYGTIVS